MMIRVLATVHVVASFIAVSVHAFVRASEHFLGPPGPSDNAVVAYYVAHVVLLIAYLPPSLAPLHQLSRSRRLVLAVVPPLLAGLGLVVSLVLALPSLIGS